MFLVPEWPEEKVGEHTVCPSCGGPCMKEGQSSSNGGVHRKGVV